MPAVIWIAVVGGLAVISQPKDAIVLAGMFFIIPGIVLLLSNTVFVYSLALLPAYIVWPLRNEAPWKFLAALAPVTLVALAPHFVGKHAFERFAQQVRAEDFSNPASVMPRSIQLPGGHCDETCERLLYGREVEAVFASDGASLTRFVLERRVRCPDARFASGANVESRRAAGECIIGQRTSSRPDVVVTRRSVEMHEFAPPYPVSESTPVWTRTEANRRDRILYRQREEYDRAVAELERRFGAQEETRFSNWVVRDVLAYRVQERMRGVLRDAEAFTSVTGGYAMAPFLIGIDDRSYIGTYPLVLRNSATSNTIEDALRRRYGWRIAPVAAAS